MSPWRSRKGIAVGSGRLDLLVEHHLRLLAVFRDFVADPAVYNNETGNFDPDFLAIAEFRYYLYLRMLLEEGKTATSILPPWDVAVLFYAHLLYPTKFCDDLLQGVWGLSPADQASLQEVLRRCTFPLMQLVSLSTHSPWSDNFSCFEWEQRYPRVPFQPWMKAREGRIVRLAQSRAVVAITVRCPSCGASLRCGVVDWRAFRCGEKHLPCRRANCQPVRYGALPPQFKSPWESPQDLSEVIVRAMSGTEAFLLGPELHTKTAAKNATARYQKFMGLLKLTRTPQKLQVLAPAADIDLCWRTHRIVPAQYRQWCTEHVGRIIEDDETGGHQIFEGGCEELTATEHMWQVAYKEPYKPLKKPFLERVFGIGGKQASKRISRMKGKGATAADIPQFLYDPTAYSTTALPSEVPARDSSINAPAKFDNRMPPPRRYTADGTMLPTDGRRSRGSFVPTTEQASRPAMSNTRSKRKSNRRSRKTVSILPAIKSMDSMMGDSDGSGEQDAKQGTRIESETGLHRTKSPLTFSNNSDSPTLTASSSTTPTSPTFSSSDAKSSPETTPEQVYENVSGNPMPTTGGGARGAPSPSVRHGRSQSLGLPVDRVPVTGKRQPYAGRPESLRGPPVSMNQRPNSGQNNNNYATTRPSSSGRPGSATRPGSSGSHQQPATGLRPQQTPNGVPAAASIPGNPRQKPHQSHYPPSSYRNGASVTGIRPSSSGSTNFTRKPVMPRSRANSLDDRPMSPSGMGGMGYAAYSLDGNVGWANPAALDYTGTGRSFSLGGYGKDRVSFQPGGYMNGATGTTAPRRMSEDIRVDGGNVEFGGGGRWSEDMNRAAAWGNPGGYEAHGSRYVGQQRARQYQAQY